MCKADLHRPQFPYLYKETIRLADLKFYYKLSCQAPKPLCSQAPLTLSQAPMPRFLFL